MGRIQHNVEAADRILADHGHRAAQHVIDLIQAAIRSGAPEEDLENLDMIMRIVMADMRERKTRVDQALTPAAARP